jgi:hypothetical protein
VPEGSVVPLSLRLDGAAVARLADQLQDLLGWGDG